MSEQQVNNLNVLAQDVLTTPEALKNAVPLTDAAERTVIEGRQTIQNILDGNDPRLLVVVGPAQFTTWKLHLIMPAASARWLTKSATACIL
ncbi:hypothetical protein HSBAA_25920 [Vreelandella sulfidaeris]|uniref:Uncharacterized protein n=1 Tax=Vreelandella sulfidaeris TaxID=115553 RepID=A0A455U5A0_9GAMM|nr:hypothetical protein HSBAA_25920 [Halomonas sulfidaeris]